MTLAADINRFFADRTVQAAIEASREARPLQICYPNEIPISRFFAWLFDPTQGHGLNGALLRSLLIACWKNGDEKLSRRVLRIIAPSSLSTHSLSDAVIERELQFKSENGRLDVLILLPQHQLLIAIENKYGARQSRDQLKRYRLALAKRFPSWDRILVFLDVYGGQPNDDNWIGLDYDWLIEELRVAEQSSWLGEEPKRAITQFRYAIDRNSNGNSLPGVDERSLLSMVRNHPTVFEQMAKWADAGETKMGLVTKLFEEGSKSDKALQLLLPVYCQRIDLWHECLPMLAYASLRSEAEQYFKDLECDPKRSAFYFSLTRWTPLERDNANCWPLQVMVRQQFDVSDDERFVVVSSLYLPEVAERHQDDICATANAMRSVHLTRKKKLEAGQRRATLRFDYCKSEQSAAKLLADQLSDLDKRFSPIALAA